MHKTQRNWIVAAIFVGGFTLAKLAKLTLIYATR